MSLCSSSRITLSGLDSCVMITASIFFGNYYGGPVVFEGGVDPVWIRYSGHLCLYRSGSCINSMSDSYCSLSFMKVSVAILECWRFICLQLMGARVLVFA
jgi:hypothetical protein